MVSVHPGLLLSDCSSQLNVESCQEVSKASATARAFGGAPLNFQSSRARNRDWLAHVISLPFSVVAVSSCVRPCSRLRELVEQKIGVTHVGADAVLMHLGRRSECPALVLGEIRNANFRLGRGTAPNKLVFGFPPECFPICFSQSSGWAPRLPPQK
jgi:hypothetical protein